MKRKQCTFASLLLLMVVAAIACGNKSNASGTEENKDKTESVNVPAFNADSAYAYVQIQANFGPRVPNTAAHRACGDYLAAKLEQLGAKVYNQYAI